MTLTVDKTSRHPGIDERSPVAAPPFVGARFVQMVLLDEIIGYINRAQLIHGLWRLTPEPAESETDFAMRSLDLFQERMAAARSQDLLQPQVAYGFFPVNRVGSELIIWSDESRTTEQLRLSFDRQDAAANRGVADFFQPVGQPDHVALQITTMGSRISSRTPLLYAGAIRESYVALHALALALLEAFNEYWHRRIRYEWGFGFEDGPSLNLLFSGFYRGARFSLTDHLAPATVAQVIDLLDAGQIDVTAGDYGLRPELTAVNLITHHRKAVAAAT